MPNKFQCEIISLDSVENLCRQLAVKILSDGYKVDIIIAIARGGYVPARLLCDYLNIHELTSIKVQHYLGTERAESAFLKYPLNADIKNKNVLLVDDVNDTGKSISIAIEHLKTFGPKQIKTAVMHEKKGSMLNTNYFIDFLDTWRWLIYEWAVVEDVGSFIIKAKCKSPEAALDMLKSDYGLNWTIDDLKKVLPFIKYNWP